LVIFVPLILIANSLIKESVQIYNSGLIEQISDFTLETFGTEAALNRYLEKPIELTTNFITQKASSFIISLPSKLLSFLIMIFVIFYTLTNGEELINKAKKLTPLKEKEELYKYLGKTTKNLIYGLFIVSILEFIVVSIGFSILNIPVPILIGLLVALLAFIPGIGPTLIWVPLALIYLLTGNLFVGIGVIITGTIISIIDTFVRPYVIGAKARIHPIIALIGILGGLNFFGISGIIIGPLILSVSIVIIDVYTKKWS